MAQTAARLVDHVIPHLPVRRQWVLSLPIPLLGSLGFANPYLAAGRRFSRASTPAAR